MVSTKYTPTRNAARRVEMALAPMAGANGEWLLALSVHAVARLVSVANRTSVQMTIPGMLRDLHGRIYQELSALQRTQQTFALGLNMGLTSLFLRLFL